MFFTNISIANAIFLVLLYQCFSSDSANGSKQYKVSRISQLHRAQTALAYNRRHNVIKCCGAERCSDLIRKTSNKSVTASISNIKKIITSSSMNRQSETISGQVEVEITSTNQSPEGIIVEETTIGEIVTEIMTDGTSQSILISASDPQTTPQLTTTLSTNTQLPSSSISGLTSEKLINTQSTTTQFITTTQLPTTNFSTTQLNIANVASTQLSSTQTTSTTQTTSAQLTAAQSISTQLATSSTTNSPSTQTTSSQLTSTQLQLTTTQLITATQSTTKLPTTTTTVLPQTTSTTTPPTAFNPICNSSISFKQDPNVFNTDGHLKDPDNYGFWVQTCDRLYLFGKSLATWQENFENCNKIGMDPVSFVNVAEQQCFKLLLPNWKYSANYWTAGFKVDNVSDKFSWCSKNGSTTVSNTEILWDKSGNDSQYCLHLNVDKENSTFSLVQESCNNSQMLACQGKPTPAPPCSAPSCPNMTCEKDNAFFTGDGNQQYLTEPRLHGNWFTYQGRSYMFSYENDTKTFIEAMTTCCAIGMKLLSLEYDYKYKSVSAAIRDKFATEGVYWTSGSNRGCKSSYGYCSVNRLLRDEAIWAPGQPDDAGGNESALAVNLNATHALLSDFNEESEFRYVCEARPVSKDKTGSTALRDECAMIYNITQTEIDNIMNLTTYDLRLKCFIKCMGDSSGLMVNGKFVSNEVLAILEKMAGGNSDELKKNMGVMGECESSSSAGMDDCDKASQMIQCTKEKAPDVVNGVITAMDQSISAASSSNVVAMREAFCYDPSACSQVNTTLRQEYDGSGGGGVNITHGYVVTPCNYYKYLITLGTMNYSQAYEACCTYGMTLVSVRNVTDVNCLARMNTMVGSRWMWVAGSRINSPDNPRWCSSNASFDLSGFATVHGDPDPSLGCYAIYPTTKEIKIAACDSQQYAICT
ncbi:uncharacterized protein LOC132192538 [Neocloeon triangulifer]|uniref:uncharacterized protein LOC132192538 n=1 Tax=Neocloeon triangulifer TaxID=2078957 RepID=UPI00286EDCBD|nr:uncharacterized protein LOC132192538 [Neocloeon triangulifer]